MERNYIKKGILYAILILLGISIGRWSIEPIKEVEYIKGKIIHDTIKNPVPYRVEVPANPVLLTKSDTIRVPGQPEKIIQVVDTAQVLAEFIKKNSYKETLFDNDTLGKLVVEPIVQYNKLQSIPYSFTPIYKQITIERKKIFTPFISASVNTLGMIGIGGGTYINNIGFELKYFPKNYLELGTHIKF